MKLATVFRRKKGFKYTSDNIKIKSEVELSNEQINDICYIIEENVRLRSFKSLNEVARNILRKIGDPISEVEFYLKRKYILVKLNKNT